MRIGRRVVHDELKEHRPRLLVHPLLVYQVIDHDHVLLNVDAKLHGEPSAEVTGDIPDGWVGI